ncbi:galactose mutarotase isoform X2 [Struthio camelus]|uniref:galactose mutarotase isoform X2 n=1 Tax=Struthio camelus TaxID=8801 RepID=UPI00360403E0
MTEVMREAFGQLPREEGGGRVEKFVLRSDSVKVELLSLGCIVAALEAKGRDGAFADVVLGFDSLEGYTKKHPFFGAVVGRVANRIAKGRFTLDGQEYQLVLNNGPNSLHGGARGFDKVLWSPEVVPNGIRFFRLSPDGEEGYPGDLKVWVTYTLCGGELAINYRAQTSKTTPISLTNHAYFNLAGQGSRDIYDHEISIEADSYLPVDDTKIPTGGGRAGHRLRSPGARGAGEALAQVRPGRLRSQLLPEAGLGPAPGGQGSAPCHRQDAGGAHHPARPPVLHGQQPGRLPGGQRLRRVSQALGLLPGNAGLARCRQQASLPGQPAAPAGGVQPHHLARLLCCLRPAPRRHPINRCQPYRS